MVDIEIGIEGRNSLEAMADAKEFVVFSEPAIGEPIGCKPGPCIDCRKCIDCRAPEPCKPPNIS